MRFAPAPTVLFELDSDSLAFRALRGMGFRERELRPALAEVAARAGAGASLGLVIRQRLLTLTGIMRAREP